METSTYRAAPSAYFVFGSITAALSVLWLTAVWRAGAPWLPLSVPLIGFVLVVLWLSRFRLTLGGGEIVLTTPFHAPRRVAWREILTVEFARQTGPTDSPLTLCIRTSSGDELRFNSKVFSAEAITRLFALSPGKSHGETTAK